MDEIIIKNFFEGNEDHALRTSDLWWSESSIRDAQSTDDEKIFNYFVVQVGFNISFYYVDDGCLYVIETEKNPIEVRKVHKNPNWDGKYILHSFVGAGSTCASGDVIFSFLEAEDLWNKITINGKSLKEVLKRSVILELD